MKSREKEEEEDRIIYCGDVSWHDRLVTEGGAMTRGRPFF